MNGTARFKEPAACDEDEHRKFANLVRAGFAGSDASLPGRIRAAERLAFWYAEDGILAAIAGLKVPGKRYRDDVFDSTDAPASAADYELELGWVFVIPSHRRRGIGEKLCERLLACHPTSRVFATTRPDNTPMIRILLALGFMRVGQPYPHPRRDEELSLFLRSSPT